MRKALISVYDKTGVVETSKELINLGYEIVSTGGTYKLLKEEGLNVVEISEVTKFPEMMGGRVKTLHPKIHAGILYRRDNQGDVASLKEHNIDSVDIVINNLYPFEKMLNEGKDEAIMIENIDIGGPSMIRAAAKNFKDVTIVVDPKDYNDVIEALKNNSLDLIYRKKLAAKAFSVTAYYDGMISSYFNNLVENDFPEVFARPLKLTQSMRYGENPHQKASLYQDGYLPIENKFKFKQLHGKEISFNNMNDLTGAINNLKEFTRPTVVMVKHTNPSGIGTADDINKAYDKAYECDEISIFGGIIALNREVTAYIAEKINSFFVEIVVAPSYTKEAFEILTKKKNIRLIEISNINEVKLQKYKYKDVINGSLLQDQDELLYQELNVVTKTQPTKQEMEDLLFGMKAVKNTSSNAVVLVKDEGTIGYGFGEVRRSWAVEKALERGKEKLKGAVMASDAFFFEDTVELLHENGIKAVVSPGGSIHDQKVIDLCDKYEMALVFTKTRHFRH